MANNNTETNKAILNCFEEIKDLLKESVHNKKNSVPVKDKVLLSIEEAAHYSHIGINKIGDLLNDPMCKFVFKVGNKRLVKREAFEKFIEKTLEI